MPRPIFAQIHPAAFLHNYRNAKARVAGSSAWAVVKANAYGHGLERVYHALQKEADGFAMLDLEEAIRLRHLGASQPLLLLEGFFEANDLPLLHLHGLSTMVHCLDQVEMLRSFSKSASAPCNMTFFIKLNTGMNRLGFSPGQLPQVQNFLHEFVGQVGGIVTHFSDADGPTGIHEQSELLERMLETLHWNGPVSVANSAAIYRFPKDITSFQNKHRGKNWVRPGISLYGASPFSDVSASDLDLKPAMSLRSQIIAIQTLNIGDKVGYGGMYQARQRHRIGIVACGYADGYPRHAREGTPVWVNGLICPLVGRVSMDMLAVNLTPCDAKGIDIRVGSPVELWGNHVPVDLVASHAQTIGYELMCALAQRVPVMDNQYA